MSPCTLNRARLCVRSLPLYERSLAIKEAKLGLDHPDTAVTLNNLAGLHKVMGKHAEALSLYERSLAIAEAKLGPDHPDTAVTLDEEMKAAKKFQEALQVAKQGAAKASGAYRELHAWFSSINGCRFEGDDVLQEPSETQERLQRFLRRGARGCLLV
jgi:tetratricopeptide (TPR) repeat protein